MFEPTASIPLSELESRWAAVKRHMRDILPGASGILLFSKSNIYYLTGTMAQGALWLPMDKGPVLMVRKGIERARLESPVKDIFPYKSYKDLQPLATEAGCPITGVAGAEFAGITWQLSEMLKSRMTGVDLKPADMALNLAKCVKSEWELAVMRDCGARHHKALYQTIPQRIKPGMTEREISIICWEEFFALGHQGMMRMNGFGEECFLGHVAAGDSGNYPSSFNGPLGLRGEHPAVPFMGNAKKVWEKGQPLGLDIGFSLQGYVTDKTQTYWADNGLPVPDEVLKAYDTCVEIQARVAEKAVPGALPEDLYTFSLEIAQKNDMMEGYMGLDGNKVPFLGHGIGLAVDEFPVLAKGFKIPLQEGMVLALEPKIGLPGVGMVGVENTFEITGSGAKSISGGEFDLLKVG